MIIGSLKKSVHSNCSRSSLSLWRRNFRRKSCCSVISFLELEWKRDILSDLGSWHVKRCLRSRLPWRRFFKNVLIFIIIMIVSHLLEKHVLVFCERQCCFWNLIWLILCYLFLILSNIVVVLMICWLRSELCYNCLFTLIFGILKWNNHFFEIVFIQCRFI